MGDESLAAGDGSGMLVGRSTKGPAMDEMNQEETPRRKLFETQHRKRSVVHWLVPLVIIIAVIIFLPRVMELLEN